MLIGASVAVAERNGDVIVVETEYRDAELIRAVPGARYKSEQHVWHVPLTWAGLLTLQGLLGDRLQVGPALEEWALDFAANVVAPALLLRESISVTPETPSPYLSALTEVLSYQRWDV
ncbi:MAG: putative helicase [Marmoricola sp.]|nr:putative helicase [Marmoricola sp.]